MSSPQQPASSADPNDQLSQLQISEQKKNYVCKVLNPTLEDLVLDALFAAKLDQDPTQYLLSWTNLRLVRSAKDYERLLDENVQLKKSIQNCQESLSQMKKTILNNATAQAQASGGGDNEDKKDDEDEDNADKDDDADKADKADSKENQNDDEDEDEEEDDQDDIISESEFVKQNQDKANQMRTSVSAEVYGDWNKKDDNFIAPVYPKSESQKSRLKETLSNCFMFSALDEKDFETCVNAMEEVAASPGDLLIKIGEQGDYLFVIEKGVLECRKEINGEDTLLKTVSAGDVFGELSLLYNCPRAANVSVKSDAGPAVLWKLDRNSFTYIVKDAASKKRNRYEGFLTKVPLLSEMDKYSISQVCDGLIPKSYQEGDTIINEGEEGNEFYILEDGEARAYKNGNEVLTYNSGDYFGELSLLRSAPRAATIKVVSPDGVKCLVLNRGAFSRLFGGPKELAAMAKLAEEKY